MAARRKHARGSYMDRWIREGDNPRETHADKLRVAEQNYRAAARAAEDNSRLAHQHGHAAWHDEAAKQHRAASDRALKLGDHNKHAMHEHRAKEHEHASAQKRDDHGRFARK